MTARDDLLAALRDGNIWGDHGRGEQLVDAYRLEVQREDAAKLYDADDTGDCGCGCWCARIIDPDVPCPRCDGLGGSQLGHACHLCDLERTTPPTPRGPSPFIPQALIEKMIIQLAAQPLLPRYTGVLAYLEDGDP